MRIFSVNLCDPASSVIGKQLAIGVVFPDGTVVVRCHSGGGRLLVYNSITDLEASHRDHAPTETTWIDANFAEGAEGIQGGLFSS